MPTCSHLYYADCWLWRFFSHSYYLACSNPGSCWLYLFHGKMATNVRFLPRYKITILFPGMLLALNSSSWNLLQSHYLLSIVLCARTLTIIVMHSKLHHMQVSVRELTSNIQWCMSALSVTWQWHQVVWVMQTHHVPISHFRSAFIHPGSSHPYENRAFFVVTVL